MNYDKDHLIKDINQYKQSNYSKNFIGCVNVCCFVDSFDICETLQESHDWVHGSFGIHPHEASKYSDEFEDRIVKNMKNPKTVAWGECGLDYFKNKSSHELQQVAFTRQLKKAVELNKPVIIHTRDAEDDTWRIMDEILPKDHRIHVHCFTGTSEFITKVFKKWENSFVGFTGCITFSNAQRQRDVVKLIPLERLLLETDGPFMAPEPLRGSIAHPNMIPIVANKVAELKEISLGEVFKQTYINANKMYNCFPSLDTLK